ncbi:MAG TPA: PIN domain-containing protein [Chlamydiales bacterium]|nr:PIN domain-containing protein [Chlamydiales bacterium]
MFEFSKKLLIDTGFVVALFNADDEHHANARTIVEKIKELKWYTTSFVVQEIFWLLSQRKSFSIACAFLLKVPSLFVLPNLPQDWPIRVANIVRRYSSAKIDLADASLVVLADHLKTGQIVSIDRKDFSILRWTGGRSHFYNLMDE